MEMKILGQQILKGEEPQVVVGRNVWQRARSLGEWTLVGCSVAPAFVFEGFEIGDGGRGPPA